MRKLLLLFLVGMILFMVATVVAYQQFGWMGLVGMLVVVFVCLWILKRMAGALFQKALAAPFKAKGAVLRGATVQVHEIVRAPQPVPGARSAADDESEDDDEYDDEDDEDEFDEDDLPEDYAQRNWYHVDVTVKPGGDTDGPFSMWEPGELMLVGPDVDPENLDSLDDETCHVADVEIWQDGQFQEDEGYKFEGPQRLRMHVGVRPGTQRLKFQYYFEAFGEAVLPGG